MKLMKRKEDVTRDDELCAGSATRGQRRERIIAPHVRMYDLYAAASHQSRQLKRASDIERVQKPHRDDILIRQRVELLAERGAWRKHSVHFVAAPSQRIHQISQVPFAAAKRPRRTDM
jgi:hypothetical protein